MKIKFLVVLTLLATQSVRAESLVENIRSAWDAYRSKVAGIGVSGQSSAQATPSKNKLIQLWESAKRVRAERLCTDNLEEGYLYGKKIKYNPDTEKLLRINPGLNYYMCHLDKETQIKILRLPPKVARECLTGNGVYGYFERSIGKIQRERYQMAVLDNIEEYTASHPWRDFFWGANRRDNR